MAAITEGGGVVGFSTPVQHIEVQSDATPRYAERYPYSPSVPLKQTSSVR